jgi:hypothetical protein
MQAKHRFSGRAHYACAFVGLLSIAPCAQADLFDRYGDAFRNVTTPATGAGSFGVSVDAMSDGRLIATTGFNILLETDVGSNDYQIAATIDATLLADPVDPGFIVVSPAGSRIAIGAGFGKPVIVFDASLLNTARPTTLTPSNASAFPVMHFAAAWLDESSLAITGGVFGQPSFVTLLDTTSDPMSSDNPVIIDNIDGASGGIVIDNDGAIYTSNGFDNSPSTPGTSDTGWIKRFTSADWSSGADFENDGLFVADLLSANTLAMDRDGALAVGGGDFSEGDVGTIAVIHTEALTALIQSGAPIDTDDTAHVKRLDPLGSGAAFYNAIFNPGTDEFLITESAGWFATSGRRVGDLDGDDVVDGDDVAALLGRFASDDVFADLNHDGIVDGADLAALLANWGDSR